MVFCLHNVGGVKDVKPMWQRLVELLCPLTLMLARKIAANAFDRASVLKECYPELDLRIVDHCKHLVQWDASDDFHELAARFLPN